MQQLIVQAPPAKSTRMLGFELFRGIAAYGVILIHAHSLTLTTVPPGTTLLALVQLSRFAVPYFLVTSLYFLTLKYRWNRQQAFNLKSKLHRLVIPYCVWSLIYLSFRAIKAATVQGGVSKLFQDPAAIAFLGSASVHLYFIPLLLLGCALNLVAVGLIRLRFKLPELIVLLALSCGLYEWVFLSGNDLQFGSNCLENARSCNVAFVQAAQGLHFNLDNPGIRLPLVGLVWLIQCLPYVIFGALVTLPAVQLYLSTISVAVSGLVFTLVSIAGLIYYFKIAYFPKALYEVASGCSLLLCAITVSNLTSRSRWIQQLGSASFGIYLMHYLVMAMIFPVLDKIYSLSSDTSLHFTIILTTITFLVSWWLTQLLSRQKQISQLLFGA